MKKKIKKIMLALVLLFFICLFMINKYLNYEIKFSKNENILSNPGRGGYIQINSGESERIQDLKEEGINLIFVAFDIEDYNNTTIPEQKLLELNECLHEAEKNNVSLIFRAAYGFYDDCSEPEKRELFSVHIRQIAAVLNEYSEQLLCVQAGMLGPYGEWHHGDYLPEDDEFVASSNRLYILSEWEKYLKKDIFVSVRRPRFIREATENGILTGRLGIYNDGLLGSDSDLGTYDEPEMDRDKELNWMDENLKYQINGGEMPLVTSWNDAENANEAFKKMHISYLNLGYNKEVLNKWKDQKISSEGINISGYKYIMNRLGYRLSIVEMRMGYQILSDTLQIEMKMEADGYAPLPEKYSVWFIVRDSDQIRYYKIESNNIYDICNGDSFIIKINIEKEGKNYKKIIEGKVAIGLKISNNKLESNQEKCIELGNSKIEYSNGFNYFVIK